MGLRNLLLLAHRRCRLPSRPPSAAATRWPPPRSHPVPIQATCRTLETVSSVWAAERAGGRPPADACLRGSDSRPQRHRLSRRRVQRCWEGDAEPPRRDPLSSPNLAGCRGQPGEQPGRGTPLRPRPDPSPPTDSLPGRGGAPPARRCVLPVPGAPCWRVRRRDGGAGHVRPSHPPPPPPPATAPGGRHGARLHHPAPRWKRVGAQPRCVSSPRCAHKGRPICR